MNQRLSYIFDEIPSCETFADIACDHGYIASEMLKIGKCKKVFAADISVGSLSKAESLLLPFIRSGQAETFVSDGFDNVPKADCALVAGIGGTLTVDILNRAKIAFKLPDTLILQPMKHCDKVRRALVELGYKIVRDFTVKSDGQFYDIILSVKGKDELTAEEIEFGRTNLSERPLAFKDKIRAEINKLASYTESETINGETKLKMLEKINRLKQYV